MSEAWRWLGMNALYGKLAQREERKFFEEPLTTHVLVRRGDGRVEDPSEQSHPPWPKQEGES